MRVLFVHTPIPGAPFNTSIAALSAYLKRHGHATAVLIVPEHAAPDAVAPLVSSAAPDVIALSFMTCRADAVRALLPVLRRSAPGARVIAGGAHPTTYPDATLASFEVDAICVGEGEEPFVQWLAEPDAPHPGILRRGANDELQRWWARDVDALPDWDRALFGDVRNDGNRFERAVGVALARGFCPYECTFCGVDAYRRANQQPRSTSYRLRTVARVLDEITATRESGLPCPEGFAAWDEILPGSRQWVRDFFTGYADRVGLPFACQLRLEQVKPELVESMVIGGCDYVVIGVETGDEDYRRKFLKKGFSNAQAREAFTRLHDAGIRTYCSFMIGLPFETPRMLAETVRLARDLAATDLSWKYYTPERGTSLFPLLEAHDLLIPKWIDHPFGGDQAMIRLTHSTQRDLDRVHQALHQLRGDRDRGSFERRPEQAIDLELRA